MCTFCADHFWSVEIPENKEQMERRIIIKFLVKFGKNDVEINQMLQEAYEKEALKEATAFKWVQDFWEGCEDPKDDARSGHHPPRSKMKTSIMCIRLCSVTVE